MRGFRGPLPAMRLSVLCLSLVVALGCGGTSETERRGELPPPDTTGGATEQMADDGRIFLALPEDGSLGDLASVLRRRRDEGTPILQIIIHTARSAHADAAQNYLDAIRALTRSLELEPEVLIGAPAEAPLVTIVTRHPAPVGP